MRVIEAVDSGSASALELEKLISTDPVLAARVLRIANGTATLSGCREVSTIRAAIMWLGQTSVRALAFSLLAQDISDVRGSHGIKPERMAHHSMCVAFLSRYLYARRQQRGAFESQFSADEVFAAGLLHDLSTPLLAQVSPDAFLRVRGFAQRSGVSIEQAFNRIYGKPIHGLASTAAASWGLPVVFGTVFDHFMEPWAAPEEFSALCCINYANFLATSFGSITEEWPIECILEPEVEQEVAIANEEAAKVMELIDAQVELYLSTTKSKSGGKVA